MIGRRAKTTSARRTRQVPAAGWMLVEDAHGDPIVQAPPPVTEQLRYIVERLRLRDADGIPRTVGVTSALDGEGAALVARALAGVLAGDADRRVCLVSLDWWTTGLSSASPPGIAQVITGQQDTGALLQQTSSPRLTYLPPGWADPATLPELVRSTELDRVLTELVLRFNNVVLELPPVRLTSESLALAGHCDACALVVLQGSTSRSFVRDAIDNLGEDRLLGIIMNQASSKVPEFLLRAVAAT